jgi:glyoxylase-like metal-dependent hydrolase (beta-lactamase superfamily II)
MIETVFNPIEITPAFYQLGTPSFPAYLSLGEDAMLIEGGTGPTSKIITGQINTLGIDPERIKYIALTHTHADHIGAIPRLRLLWPHLKVITSSIGSKFLANKKMIKEFMWLDQNISTLMFSKGQTDEIPPALDEYKFDADIVVKEGDKIDLGKGVVWSIYSAPGHSPCHLAWYEELENTLVIGDTTGFYVPEKDTFWPNYFDSLEDYTNTILKLSSLPARRGVLSHNGVIDGHLREYFEKALNATEAYHNEMLSRVDGGEDAEKVAVEKAEWVNNLTDIQPFKVMLNLTRLLIMRSQKEAAKETLFSKHDNLVKNRFTSFHEARKAGPSPAI